MLYNKYFSMYSDIPMLYTIWIFWLCNYLGGEGFSGGGGPGDWKTFTVGHRCQVFSTIQGKTMANTFVIFAPRLRRWLYNLTEA